MLARNQTIEREQLDGLCDCLLRMLQAARKIPGNIVGCHPAKQHNSNADKAKNHAGGTPIVGAEDNMVHIAGKASQRDQRHVHDHKC